MAAKIQFSDFYKIDDISAMLAHEKTDPKDNNWNSPKYKEYMVGYKIHREVLREAIGKYMTTMRDADALTPVEFTKDRGHSWANAWNRFIVNNEAEKFPCDLSIIVEPICSALHMSFFHKDKSSPKESLSNLNDIMSKGAFESWALGTSHECDVIGVRLIMDIQEGWRPRLGTLDHSKNSYTFNPLTQDVPDPQVLVHQIPAPTGEMLITDWFRFKNNLFTELVKTDAPEDSINTSIGCAKLTEHYAKNFGFMSIFVGNTCPAIVKRDDHVLIGCVDEDAYEGYDDDNYPDELPADAVPVLKGKIIDRVCTDLWWATMIDKEVLITLLATKSNRIEAEKQVDDYLKNNDVAVVQLPVSSTGNLFFHFAANKKKMTTFVCDDVDQAAVNEPYVVISDKALTWRRVDKNKKLSVRI